MTYTFAAALACSAIFAITISASSAQSIEDVSKSEMPESMSEDQTDVVTGESGEAGASVACPGIYSRCVGYVPGQDHMAVVNAQSSSHCWTLAKRCAPNVSRTVYFGGQVRVVCAPLQVCSAR